MRVSGSATVRSTPERVWTALNDPAVLARAIPGCDRLETLGPSRFRATVTMGTGAVRGTYIGDLTLSDHRLGEGFTVTATGVGIPGSVTVQLRVRLTEQGPGRTLIGYDAEAVLSGAIEQLGRRLLSEAARRLSRRFFDNLTLILSRPVPDLSPATGEVPEQAPPPVVEALADAPSPEEIAELVRAPSDPQLATATTAEVPMRSGARRGVRIVRPPGPVRPEIAGVLVGATVALLGVLLGWAIGRRAGVRPD